MTPTTMPPATNGHHPGGDDEPRLTAADVATMLGVSVGWIYTSDVPRYKVGKYVRFSRRDVLAWLAARRTEPAR